MERIQVTPEDLVRAVLIALCNDAPIRKRALEHLTKLEIARVKQPQVASASHGAKRKASEPASSLHVCVQCHEVYSEADNSSTACQFHDGKAYLVAKAECPIIVIVTANVEVHQVSSMLMMKETFGQITMRIATEKSTRRKCARSFRKASLGSVVVDSGMRTVALRGGMRLRM